MRCLLEVTEKSDEIIVSGNLCSKGDEFGRKAISAERRILRYKVSVEGGYFKEVFIKTHKEIAREYWIQVDEIVEKLELKAPIEFGEILVENILGTGVNIISERKI